MVVQAKSIKGSAKGLRYQSDDKGQAVELTRNGLYGDKPNSWNEQMSENEKRNTRVAKRRFSIVLAPSKEVSQNLSATDWKGLVEDYLDKMQIDKTKYQYIAHLHTSTDDPHAHLTVSRIPMAQNIVALNDNHIGQRSGVAADMLATDRGWTTARNIATAKKQEIALALRAALKTAVDYKSLTELMLKSGYQLDIAQNEAKGVYGMRIIPIIDINANPSQRAAMSKGGFKLSEIPRQEGRKATFRIADINWHFERNTFAILNAEERRQFAAEKHTRTFGEQKQTSFIDEVLKPNHVSTGDDDLTKKKRRKKR